jgi:hypothetical protein
VAVPFDDLAPSEIDCGNFVDDDGNGRTDCQDPACDGNRSCKEANWCSDGRDNDLNGLVDADDPRCWGLVAAGSLTRFRVRRCASIHGTRLEGAPLAADWSGPVESSPEGLSGPLASGEFRATRVAPSTGARAGSRFSFVIRMSPQATTLGIGLRPWEGAPESRAPTASLRVSREDGSLQAVLAAESETPPIEIARVEPAATVEVHLEMTLEAPFSGADCGRSDPAATCAGLLGRVRVGAGGPWIDLILPDEPPRAGLSPSPAVRLDWLGSGGANSLALVDVDVERLAYDECLSENPPPALAVLREVHAVTGSRDQLCVSGRGRAGLVTIGARLPPERNELPEWRSPSVISADGDYALVTATSDEPAFVLVTQSKLRLETLSIRTSDDCREWGGSRPVELADLPQELGGGEQLDLVAVGVGLEGQLTLWFSVDDVSGLYACQVDRDRGRCAHGRILRPTTAFRRLALPGTTGFQVGSDLLVFNSLRQPGVFVFDEARGPQTVDPILEGSTVPGTFDRFLVQGAMWISNDLLGSSMAGTIRPGWIVYGARAAPHAALRVGLARVELFIDRPPP